MWPIEIKPGGLNYPGIAGNAYAFAVNPLMHDWATPAWAQPNRHGDEADRFFEGFEWRFGI